MTADLVLTLVHHHRRAGGATWSARAGPSGARQGLERERMAAAGAPRASPRAPRRRGRVSGCAGRAAGRAGAARALQGPLQPATCILLDRYYHMTADLILSLVQGHMYVFNDRYTPM